MNRILSDEEAVLSFSSAKSEALIESKQQQIVEGALKLFYHQGFHPTTIRQIADSCNMSMGQLYHYISSKDDVLYLVHKYFHSLWYEYMDEQKIKEFESPVEKLVVFLKSNIEFISTHRKLIEFISTETKYLKGEFLQSILNMERDTTIATYHAVLVEVDQVHPIDGDLQTLASILTYTLAFYSLKRWTVRNKVVADVNHDLLVFILKGLGNGVFEEASKYL